MRALKILICLCYCLPAIAQKETSNWYFSGDQGISFNSGVPQAISGIPSSLSFSTNTGTCSDAAGNLLFMFTNGVIYDRNYNVMPGPAPATNVSYYGVTLWARYPGSPGRYLIFYPTPSATNQVYYLKYAVLDMSLNSGLGAVTTADVIVDSVLSLGYCLISKKGTDEFWIVNNNYRTNNFYARPVTASGVSALKVTSVAGTHLYPSEYYFTTMKASPNGEMFAGTTYTYYNILPFPYMKEFIEVFNFNNQTGAVTNKVKRRTSNTVSSTLYIEFSPDNKLLYVNSVSMGIGLQPCGFASSSIYQHNLCYTDSVTFTYMAQCVGNRLYFCAYPFWGNIQAAIDKQLYVRYYGNEISSIQYPNNIGTHCTLNSYAFTNAVISSDPYLPGFYHKEIEKAIINNIVYSGGCYPAPQTFSVTNNLIDHIQWNFGDPASGAQNTATSLTAPHVFSSPGNYTVTALLYDAANTLVETINRLVEIKDPGIRLLHDYPIDTTFCSGNSLTLHLHVVNGIFDWSESHNNTAAFQSGISDSFTISSSGTYYVHMHQNDCDGCERIDSIHVTVLPVPYINIGPDHSICTGDSVHIGVYDFDNNINCTWSTGQTTDSIWVSSAGQYWVSGEILSNGCPKKDTLSITIIPPVVFSLPADTTLCSGQSLLLNVTTNGATYLWQDGSVSPVFNVNAPGLYWVKVTKNNCFKRDSIVVNYVTAQQVNLGNDTTLCVGNSITLTSGIAGDAYLWSTGSATSSILVNSTGEYWLKLLKNGCWATDTINIQFNPIPVFSLGNDTTLCENRTLLLQAPVTGTYLWQNNSASSSLLVNTADLYWLNITAGGCSYRDTINVNYKPSPQVYLGNDTSICEQASLLINAWHSNTVSYLWQDGSMNVSFTAAATGIYFVTVTAANGCTNKDSIAVTEIQLPSFNLGVDTAICSGKNLQLTTHLSNIQHLWNTGSTANNITVSNAGLYWVEIENNGCTKRDSIDISLKASPVLNLGNDSLLCDTQTLLLNAANTNSTFLWQDGSNQPAFLVHQAGSYWVTVNENNCIALDSITIRYKFTPVFTLGADKEICPGNSIAIDPLITEDAYLWQDGSTNQLYIVKQPGLYSVTISNECGSTTDAVLVNLGMCNVYVPNSFTPNEDWLNDRFKVKIAEPVSYFHLAIYNRYGQLMFETYDKAVGWDGKFNGIEQQTGAYVYTLKYTLLTTGKTFTKNSSVLLIH